MNIDGLERKAGFTREEREEREEAKDQTRVERAARLARFLKGEAVEDVWPRDLEPLILTLYGRYERLLLAGDNECRGALKVLLDLMEVIGGSLEMGRASFKRQMIRRFGKENILSGEETVVSGKPMQT